MKGWNFNTSPNQEEPALFQTWWEQFYKLLWAKWEIEGKPIEFPNKYQTTLLLKNSPEDILFDNPDTDKTETAADIVWKSFELMVAEMNEWVEKEEDYTWANFKGTSVVHLVPNFKSFSKYKVYTGGTKGVLNATSERHGASWRMVVELGEKVKAYGIYPGGQSGNPGSKYYDNFLKKWANGEYVKFDLRSEQENDNVLFTTLFSN